MSAQHNQRIIERAKVMWTEEGLSPHEIIEALRYERDAGLLNVPKGTAVPVDKSSIHRWANKWDWLPNWKDVKAVKNEPAQREEMSVVEQVLYHLAENRAFLLAREHANHEPFRSEPTEAVLYAIQMDLATEYNPPPVVFRTLRPKLRARIRQEKNNHAKMRAEINEYRELHPPGPLAGEAASGRGMQEILAEALASGIEIDDGHAGLDIVYTNPEEPEVNED